MLFLQALLLGFIIAAPVGPIGILCIQRTLWNGRLAGLLTGLGAATADGLYGCIAAFGLTMISNLLVSHAFWLRLGGGLFLCYLGVKTLLSRSDAIDKSAVINKSDAVKMTVSDSAGEPGGAIAEPSHSESLTVSSTEGVGSREKLLYGSMYGSTVLLTLTNPMTILMFTGVFAGSGLATKPGDYGSAAILVTSVFLGSALWWLLLSFGVSLLRTKFNLRRLRGLSKISGFILLVFGIVALHAL
jgi:threonine/homoserine/homoserine lactone efflux protein